MKRWQFVLMVLFLIIIGFWVLMRFTQALHSQKDEKIKSTTPSQKVIREKVKNEKE